jgi:D-alanyl-D-alanine carboxypeptidase
MIYLTRIIQIIILYAFFVSTATADDACKLVKPLETPIQKTLDTWRLKEKIPSIVVSFSLPYNPCIYNFYSGTTLKDGKTHVNAKTLFQIGSLTKTFIAAIILQLESEGKLRLEDPISQTVKMNGQWLPQDKYERWKNITIKQLLNMTSGIYNYQPDAKDNKVWTNEDLLDIAYNHPQLFAPGTKWQYSNTNYILLGMLIAKISHDKLENVIKQRVLITKHYQLKNTFYVPGVYPSHILARMAHGYDANFKDVTDFNMSVAGAAGAMVSTSEDVVTWVRALFNGMVMPDLELKQMMDTIPTNSAESSTSNFGLGIFKVNTTDNGDNWTYVGGTYGYEASYMWLTKIDTVIAITIDKLPEEPFFLSKLSNQILTILEAPHFI